MAGAVQRSSLAMKVLAAAAAAADAGGDGTVKRGASVSGTSVPIADVVPKRRTSRGGVVAAGCVIDTIVNERMAAVAVAVAVAVAEVEVEVEGLGRRWACPCQCQCQCQWEWEWGFRRSLGARCMMVVSQAVSLTTGGDRGGCRLEGRSSKLQCPWRLASGLREDSKGGGELA